MTLNRYGRISGITVPVKGTFIFILASSKERIKEMKKTLKVAITLTLLLCAVFAFTACSFDTVMDKMPWNKSKEVDVESLKEGETYKADTELGTGSKTVIVKVETLDTTVTFTIHTDKDTVGAALLEHNIIEGEEGAYGLYVKKVNGIVADYDVDQSYWAFYIGDDYAMRGVELTEITEGKVYRLVYTK